MDKQISILDNKKPWNYGKRKPQPDQDNILWCACIIPNLISPIGRGQAYCLKCHTPYYH